MLSFWATVLGTLATCPTACGGMALCAGLTVCVLCRQQVLRLGPTFIKVGQLFSTRSDLFPLPFTTELAKLQDRVPAFSPTKAMQIIEAELGAPVSHLFSSFDERPLAAASLGQVSAGCRQYSTVLHSHHPILSSTNVALCGYNVHPCIHIRLYMQCNVWLSLLALGEQCRTQLMFFVFYIVDVDLCTPCQ